MAVSRKIINGNAQPKGGAGIVSIAGANGLGSTGTFIADIANTNVVNPFPPYETSMLDDSIADIDAAFDERFDDPRYYSGDLAT